MKIDYNELFPEGLSDECTYHLMHFFENLAFVFKKMHVFQIIRHENVILSDDFNNSGVEFLDFLEKDNNGSDPF